jgi:CHAT domain-containing protein
MDSDLAETNGAKRDLVLDDDSGKKSGQASAEDGDNGPRPEAYAHPYYWAPFILMGNWL